MSSTAAQDDAQPPATKEGRPNLASPFVIVEQLRRPVDTRQRIRAINAFVKRLGRGESFQPTWSAAGGAAGIAKIMSAFSLNEVYRLCRQLGRTASAMHARKERRDGLGELVTILATGDTDPRPLEDYYQFIVPACHESIVYSWEIRPTVWTRMQRRWMVLGHRQLCEQRLLSGVFSERQYSVGSRGELSQSHVLFRDSVPLSEMVLTKLESLDSNEICIPRDFVGDFVLPLLRRLAKPPSSGSPENLHKCLGLVVRCFQKHARLFKNDLSLLNPNGLAKLVTQFWVDSTGKDRESFRRHLETLYGIIGPTNYSNPSKLYDMMSVSKRQDAASRYELLCILLQHLTADGHDLVKESLTSMREPKSLGSKLSSMDLWPANMFLSLPPDKSLALFLQLKQLHQGQSFVSRPIATTTILNQEQTIHSRTADLDIVETVLRLRAQPEDLSWSERVRTIIQTRIRDAMESREAAERGFWIKSAINLCVAAQELELLTEALRLARRFTRDQQGSSGAWGLDFLQTRQFLQLLTIVPEVTKSTPSTTQFLEELSLTAQRNMVLAHNVVLTLLRIALAAVGGPGFKEDKWELVIGLPGLIAQRRERNIRAIQKQADESARLAANVEQDIDAIVSEVIWKPTIKQLLEVESLMNASAAPKTWVSTWQGSDGPLEQLLHGLPLKSPALLAEMTRYSLATIRSQTSPALARTHMSSIAKMTISLAKSSQPSLALPFIQTIIQNGDSSVDHRQLLTHKLLSKLPSDTARDFLKDLVQALTGAMARQNIEARKALVKVETMNERNDTDHISTPGVKVTTIKMVAQLLNGTLGVDISASCEMLVSLLEEARHIDARVGIIRSLVRTLETRSAKPALRARVLDMLEMHVLPIASQLHERRQISELDWHREDGTMPEVSEANTVFDLLLQGLRRKMLQPEDHARLAGLVMKSLEESAQINRRWMISFVERSGFGKDMFQDIPVAPAHISQLVYTFAQMFNQMPDSIFTMLREAIMINILPPARLLRVTRHVKADASLRDSNAGQHWLKQYDNPGSAAYLLGLNQALGLLSNALTEEPQVDAEKALQLRGLWLAAADRCIRGGDPDTVYSLVDEITVDPRQWTRILPGANTSRSSLVREIISLVEQARDKGTNTTSRLPDVFPLRLALLKLAQWDDDLRLKEADESTISAFAGQVSDLVDLLVSPSPRPYHTEFELLKRQLWHMAKSLPGFARVAIKLGRVHGSELVVKSETEMETGRQPSLAAYLCIELAADSLQASITAFSDAGSIESVQLLVRDWTESSDIAVKKAGLQVAKGMQQLPGHIAT